ncbi:MAG: AAA family ATPase [Massilia sp.]
MRILKIAGKNLASLAGEFTVDFEQEPLASSGLFAISGPTGAGKSTLLDALCLALYDATPRLLNKKGNVSMMPDVGAETVSAQDPRSLLRRGAAEAWAEVDFVGNDMLRYRSRWTVRRSYHKATGVLQGSKMSLHRLPDLAPIGGTKTEVLGETAQRIGLSFDQFTRAVLLAQNEFSAFLKTDENDRGELLETLTGSTIYSLLSRRAYERYKLETGVTAQLSARLADQAPLPAEERAGLELELAGADARLAAIDVHKAGIEQQLRWHHEAARLAQGEGAAQLALTAALEQADTAAARRRRLALLDAVQPARALVADIARVDAEQETLRIATLEGEQQLLRALEGQQQAALAVSSAAAQCRQADDAQRQAAPQLDRAKALDAGIAALAATHAQSLTVREAAARGAVEAETATQQAAAALTLAQEAQAADAAWLVSHREHEVLARQWPRWDSLLIQAEQAAGRRAALADDLNTAHSEVARLNTAEAAAAQASLASAQILAHAQERRQAAADALAAIDLDALQAAREAIDTRREQLGSARSVWDALLAAAQGLQLAQDELAQLAASRTSADNALARALDEAAPLAAAAEKHERLLAGAEMACAASVEDMRAQLNEDEACPVCGSAEHPYQHQGVNLHAMLDELRGEVKRCRALAADNLTQQAAQRALLARTAEHIAQLERDSASRAAALEKQQAAWRDQPLAAEAPDEASRAAWLAAEHEQLKASAAAHELEATASRRAAQARDAAQAALDQATGSHAGLLDAAVAARTALASAQARHMALADKQSGAAQSIADLLDELDPAFADGWRTQWEGGASAFRAQREADAREWQQRHAQHAARETTLGTLGAEHRAALERLSQARKTAEAALAEFTKLDAETGARRQERQLLWDGRPVSEIEHILALAIEQARTALASAQSASALAAQSETRVREAISQAALRREALAGAREAAAAALTTWLAGFADRHPDLDAPGDTDGTLAALLAIGHDAIASERRAIHEVDSLAASAATVLAERRAQRAQHQVSMPPDCAPGVDTLDEALGTLLASRTEAQQVATGLRLRVAEDESRRVKAAAILGDIERRQAIEQRWGKLSDLIGSADGKKFRNYAQQFTLDVLLGYANGHLRELAKRYRLERVLHANGPSLGLMVRDQDMGGEVRSVNSLSGGESFLVSLALALGLASLSSNRVKVESLFIDEGFGSLDSDTLRVAMDALDGLQSMGRKVGVISHVQEMTERIATKILVLPSGGGSSSVRVQ